MTVSLRDSKDVSDLVSMKLEWYLNVERRENRFNTQGYYRTTPRMHAFDLMYQLLDKTELDLKAKTFVKQISEPGIKKTAVSHQTCKGNDNDASKNMEENKQQSPKTPREKDMEKPIQPVVVQNSLRVVSNKEAERLVEYANNVFNKQPLDKLQVIHRYRPLSSDIPPIVENGRVHNYTRHVGSALGAKKYVEYYMSQGLQTGRKEYSKRLQGLKPAKKETPLVSHLADYLGVAVKIFSLPQQCKVTAVH